MKRLIYALLVLILISGGIQITCQNTEGGKTVRVDLENPEKAVEAAKLVRDQFEESLQAHTEQTDSAACASAAPVQSIYRIRNAACDPASQIGAYCDYETAKSLCQTGYCVFDQNGTMLYSAEN